MEFLTAAGGFLRDSLPMVQQVPELGELAGELLMFGVRSFKSAAPIEAAFEGALQKINNKPPAEQQPDPEMIKAQAQQQTEQGRMQLEQAKMQATAQTEQMKMQVDGQALQMKAQFDMQMAQMKAEQDAAIEAQRLEFERWKAELDASTKVTVAQISAETSLKQSAMSASSETMEYDETGAGKPASGLASLVEAVNQNMMSLMEIQTQNTAAISQEIRKPRRRVLERGPDGRAIGAIEVIE